jgi:hypothetical protein
LKNSASKALNFISKHDSGIQKWISKNPKILFAGFGQGLGGDTLLLVSIHKNLTDLSEFTREIKV